MTKSPSKKHLGLGADIFLSIFPLSILNTEWFGLWLAMYAHRRLKILREEGKL